MSAQPGENGMPVLDPYWLGVTEFLERHSVAPWSTLAPREFGPHLEGSIPYERAGDGDVSGLDCAVLHKGMLARLPARFLRTVLRRLVPAYANAVFVVYCREIFEPLESAEHIKAFLEQIPDEDDIPPAAQPPLAVYCGGGRMICRDPNFRKLIVPARAKALLTALMRGENPVAELAERLAPFLSGARRVIDYGAGIGLLALAAKEKAAPDCVVAAIEDDALWVQCLKANIDLAGLAARAEIVSERPRLGDIGRVHGSSTDTAWLAIGGSRFDFTVPCDALHIDLDFARGDDIGGIAAFLDQNGRPPLILSRGLAGRMESTDVDEAALLASLRPLGYGTDIQATRCGPGSVTMLRLERGNAGR
ncbi:MAG: hypothetical protein M9932_06365 [Xanthobacteraceae bacterium]|nr:hypothetical protein [Xanthobacteraceae bacterium]